MWMETTSFRSAITRTEPRTCADAKESGEAFPQQENRMPVHKRDVGFIAVIGVVLALLLVSTGRVKPKKVPADDRHRHFLAAMARGDRREEVEKGCAACHNDRVVPLPRKHPPKEQCLICHVGK
jgi:hypothetical protein